MKAKIYTLENDWIGTLLRGEEFSSYISAMKALLEIIEKDQNDIVPIHKEYPNSKWKINRLMDDGEMKVMFSVFCKKAIK